VSELTTLQTQLAEAEKEYHSLMTGNKVATASSPDGGSVTYTQASMKRLEAYIASLKSKISILESSTAPGRSPIYFVHPE